MDDFTLSVTFMPRKNLDRAKLIATAAQLDEEQGMGYEPDFAYSVGQAITVVLHYAPGRINEFCDGWTVNESWEQLGDID